MHAALYTTVIIRYDHGGELNVGNYIRIGSPYPAGSRTVAE
jgi:hypothetical protein